MRGSGGVDRAASGRWVEKRAIAIREFRQRDFGSNQPGVKYLDLANRLLAKLSNLSNLRFGHPNGPGRSGAAVSTASAAKLQPIFVPRLVHREREFMQATVVSQSVGGIVLCGGRSTRMGQPKLTLPFAGEPMLLRVVRALQTTVNPVVVVAAPDQEVPPLPSDVRLLRDEQEFLGPLAGIAVGLQALLGEVEAAFVSSCDVPLLRPEFIAEMIHRLGHHDLAVPKDGKFHHPLAAVYRTSLAETAGQLVAAQRLRPLFLIQACDSIEVPVDELRGVDADLRSLRNLNCPEDYEAALRLAGLPNS